MEPERNDIEQPLGQERRTRRERRRRLPGAGTVLLSLAALCLIGVSTAIALRDRPFRDPPRASVTAPETAEAADTAGTANDAAAKPRKNARTTAAAKTDEPPSPSIVRMGEEAASSSSGKVIVVHDPSTVGQNQRIAHLPDRALIEESEMGPLPVRGADGQRPFDVYARPWSGARGARIAVVIGGLGLSQTGTQEAIRTLPAEITLAFAPQGNSLDRWMQNARRAGHEILMQVPLEPFDYPNVNPGRNTLTVNATPAENLHDLRWTLSRITNYTGLMNYMGARFVADADVMDNLMRELGQRGLMFLDDGTSARSVAERTARENGVPFAGGDVRIDASRDRGAILEKLDELERIARARGYAVGTGSAFDVTVEALTGWANEVKKRGIELVPISAVADDPEAG